MVGRQELGRRDVVVEVAARNGHVIPDAGFQLARFGFHHDAPAHRPQVIHTRSFVATTNQHVRHQFIPLSKAKYSPSLL